MLICVFVVFFLTTFRSWTHGKGRYSGEKPIFLPEGIAGKTERDGTDDGKNKTRERSRVVPVGGILPTGDEEEVGGGGILHSPVD